MLRAFLRYAIGGRPTGLCPYPGWPVVGAHPTNLGHRAGFVQCNNSGLGHCAVHNSIIYEFIVRNIPAQGGTQKGSEMSDVQKFGEEFQRVGKDGFDAAVHSFGEVNKGLQAIAAEVTDYSKKAFEDGTRAFEQLLGAKSFEQVIEIQSQYAKKAYDTYIAELSKLGEMYAGLTRNAYKPVEQAAAKAGSPYRRSA